jgi:hypothetical protein
MFLRNNLNAWYNKLESIRSFYMKKIATTTALIIAVLSTFAQNNPSVEILVRHDTTTIKPEENELIMKPLTNTGEKGKSIPFVIFQAINKGQLRAFDPITNTKIPAKEIFTWAMSSDTFATVDGIGNIKYNVTQAKHNPDNITLIRVCQDWYFDVTSCRFRSEIKWLELLEEVKSASGYFIGNRPLCKIYY